MNNTTGNYNVADGRPGPLLEPDRRATRPPVAHEALNANATGSYNTAVNQGSMGGDRDRENIAIGAGRRGSSSSRSGSDNLDIFNVGEAGTYAPQPGSRDPDRHYERGPDADLHRGIYGATVSDPANSAVVVIDDAGNLGTAPAPLPSVVTDGAGNTSAGTNALTSVSGGTANTAFGENSSA